ncbi:MAG: large-conductance mechanosensitive channel protein MscL [Bacteroidales bacterium]|nr:large-conductance mechanosensitive channel protein MscL [Bacteroidales bacterium]
MKIVKEFKEFAMRGNVIDMAVGIIIGAAFGKIVSSLVDDIIMPPIGYLLGGVNFSDLSIVIKEAVGDMPAVTLNYGSFIQVVLDFLIIAFAIFMVIKAMNAAKKKKEVEEEKVEETPAEPEASIEQQLLSEILEQLKK